MKTKLLALAIAGLSLLGTPVSQARSHESRTYVSGYDHCGRPVYSERYLIGYDHCGRPIWGTRVVRTYYAPRVETRYVERYHRPQPRVYVEPSYRRYDSGCRRDDGPRVVISGSFRL